MLTQPEQRAIESNIFPLARPIVSERPEFPWHRDGDGITSSRTQSSQALAVDLFETVQRLDSRNLIVDAWAHEMKLPVKGPWRVETEWLAPVLLGEPRPTQIDAVAQGHDGLVTFECKFTEPGGGVCSQPLPLATGQRRGLRQCSGNYELQTNPVNSKTARCALSAKGIRYWDFVPDVLSLDAFADHRPCPFAGGWYQWMRNLVVAAAAGRAQKVPAAFVLVYAGGPFPVAKSCQSADWLPFVALVAGPVRIASVSYQTLLSWAIGAARSGDQALLAELRAWILGRIETVAKQWETDAGVGEAGSAVDSLL